MKIPELSPRELAARFTNSENYFVSEASVYRILKAHDLITSPAFIVIIGYALVVGVERSLKDRFWPQSNQPSVIKIENLGLFPGEEGGGRGWGFFQLVMNDLFESSDIVYWLMSSSNFPTLLNYYRDNGMKVFPCPRQRSRSARSSLGFAGADAYCQ